MFLHINSTSVSQPSDPVYYRVGTPEQGLRGLGQYENQRQEMNVNRQREYNDFLREVVFLIEQSYNYYFVCPQLSVNLATLYLLTFTK